MTNRLLDLHVVPLSATIDLPAPRLHRFVIFDAPPQLLAVRPALLR
jgi:hypothetical protein